MIELYLVRHGQTDLNIGDHYQGVSDVSLNALGQQQALALLDTVPDTIQQLIVSPQLRARQTAEPLQRARSLPVEVHPAFRERNFGAWEGLSPSQAAALNPEPFAAGGIFRWDWAPEGAETLAQLQARCSAGLIDICQRHAGRAVLLVIHGFVIRMLRYQLQAEVPAAFIGMPRPLNGQLFHYPAATVQRWLQTQGD